MNKAEITKKIKNKALEIGFDSCGISCAEELNTHKEFLMSWLERGLHATMLYMKNNFEKRTDPTKLVDGAKSVISVLMNYYPPDEQPARDAPKIAKYAYGEDYHYVIKERLNILLGHIKHFLSECNGRVFTDSAPVLERAWAAKSGLGWIGKNTNLIVPKKGSFFFIGELIVDIELEYDSPVIDMCGTCTKCLNACPTNALVVPYLLDSNRCISYHTIENKESLPETLKGKFDNWVFGCDICQDVCPWNKFSRPTDVKEFHLKEKLAGLSKDDWYKMSEEDFKNIFRKSPVKRTKYDGLKRNLEFIKKG